MAIPGLDPPGWPSVTVIYPVLVTVSVPREFVAMEGHRIRPGFLKCVCGVLVGRSSSIPEIPGTRHGQDRSKYQRTYVRGPAPDLLLEVDAATGGVGTSTTVRYPFFTLRVAADTIVTVRDTVNAPVVYVNAGPAAELSTSPSPEESHAYVNGAVP